MRTRVPFMQDWSDFEIVIHSRVLIIQLKGKNINKVSYHVQNGSNIITLIQKDLRIVAPKLI